MSRVLETSIEMAKWASPAEALAKAGHYRNVSVFVVHEYCFKRKYFMVYNGNYVFFSHEATKARRTTKI